MANIKRSIWEIRFYALKEVIWQEQKNICQRLAAAVLTNGVSVEERNISRAEIKQLEYLKKVARELTKKNAKFIYLERDF